MVIHNRAILGIILVLIIFVTGIFVYKNRHSIFMNRVIIEYPDGCFEIFINGILNSSECTNGRNALEQQKPNLSFVPTLPGIIKK